MLRPGTLDWQKIPRLVPRRVRCQGPGRDGGCCLQQSQPLGTQTWSTPTPRGASPSSLSFLAACDLCLVGSCPVPRGPGAPASAHWPALPSRSGGHFLSTAERIRLPDDCTIGYIVEALLGVPLIRSGLFHSHLENLQQVPASELHEQVCWPWGPGREGRVGVAGLNREVRRGLTAGRWLPSRCRLPRRHGPPRALSSLLPSSVLGRLARSASFSAAGASSRLDPPRARPRPGPYSWDALPVPRQPCFVV